MTIRTVTTSVDVDLSDFEDSELIEELESRDIDTGPFFEPLKVYNMFTIGRDGEAIAECKKMIEQVTGRILP